jgi:hypothetical protein
MLLYSWLPCGSHHKTLAIWNFKNRNLANFGQFCHEKCFVEIKILFFRPKFGKKIPVKEILPLILNSGCEPVFSFHFSIIDILVKFNPKKRRQISFFENGKISPGKKSHL